MTPVFEQAVNFKGWALAATLSIATALASAQQAQAAYVGPNSIEDYILSDIRQDSPALSNLDELKTINQIGSSRVRYQKYMHELNRFEAAPDDARFQQVNMFSARQLYEMMVYGGEEFYESSYDGVFDRFESAMESRNRTSVFEVTPDHFRASVIPFLNQAVAYDAQSRAVQFIQPDQWPEVLDMFAARIGQGDRLAMVTLAETAHAVQDPQVKRQIEGFMQNQYDTARAPALKDGFGLSAGYYNDLAGRAVITLQSPGLYAPKPVQGIDGSALFGTDGVHRQLVVFPNNDPKAEDGFDNFVSTYLGNSNYQLEDFGSFVKISSIAGNPVEIYANYPSDHPNDIFEVVGGQNFGNYSDVQFDAVIDRSAFDFKDNVDPYISANNAFIFAGKNGDSHNTRVMLQFAPDTQIISTPRTGTPANPDQLLFSVTESVRVNGRVDWGQQSDFLATLGQQNAFVLPPENRTQTITNTAAEMIDIRRLGAQRPLARPSADL